MKCPLCDYANDKIVSLSLHFRRTHNSSSKHLYVILFCDNVEPTCACGCGSEVKFHNIVLGFSKYKRGHVARVKNNWGHNEAVLQKSQAVRREMHKRGEIKIWCKGLTKETDERVASYGRKQSENCTTECREKRSEMMKKYRLDKTIPDLCGKDHSQWKGGVSSVAQLAHSYNYKSWIYPKLKASNFTCSICQSRKNLQVHHDEERFAQIAQKARAELGDISDENDFELKTKYAQWIADYHVKNDVHGVVLCESCHKGVHNEESL